MGKKRNSKTRQGLCGVTLAQGLRLTRDAAYERDNVHQVVSQFSDGYGNVRMPLNRGMRRYAKSIGIELKKGE